MTRPPHLGRQTDVETGYALVCNSVGRHGDPNLDPLCGRPATHHLLWEGAENSFTCNQHLNFALEFDPLDVHSVENSACGMPDSFWVPGEPSHCTMLALDEDPHLVGAATQAVPA
jgi:hypothetical protein